MNLGKNTESGFMPGVPSLADIERRIGLSTSPSPDGSSSYDNDLSQAQTPRAEVLQCYVQVFSTPAGQRVLDDLLDQTLRRAVFSPGGNGVEQVTLNRVFRDGQNNLACHILKSLVDGKRLSETPKRSRSKKSA